MTMTMDNANFFKYFLREFSQFFHIWNIYCYFELLPFVLLSTVVILVYLELKVQFCVLQKMKLAY